MSHTFTYSSYERWFDTNIPRIISEILDLVSVDTTTPHEARLFPVIAQWLSELGFVVRVEGMHPDVSTHYHASLNPKSDMGTHRSNLRAELFGRHTTTTLFSVHVDVVPPSSGFELAFSPYTRNGAIYGRGTCDTKGNLVMLLTALRFVHEAGLELTRNIHVDVVVEEEIGGNGALSTVLHGVPADEVIVLEPTGLQLYRGHRGCVTFTIEVFGKAVHMGADQAGISAITVACALVQGFTEFERDLLEQARNDPDYLIWKRPLQLNVGSIKGGEWPGSVPATCTVHGNLGFLPNLSIQEAMDILSRKAAEIVRSKGATCSIKFDGLKTDSYIIPSNSPLVRFLLDCINASSCPKQDNVYGWNVSCDARLYPRLLDIPTVIFGAGNLVDAHSDHEHITIGDIRSAAEVLIKFLTQTY